MSNYKGFFRPDDPNNSWTLALNLVKKNSKVLDVGCSNGNFGEALAHFKGCRVDGIEPDDGDSKLAQSKLRKVYNTTVEQAIDDIKTDGKKYDHIVFLDVIEHLFDPVSVLESLSSILGKNGSVIFSIPNMGHQSVRIMLLRGDFEYGETGILDNTHMHFYTEREINNVFNNAGYEVTSLKGTSILYGDDMLKAQLKKVGIHSASDDLLATLSSNNAHIYQYIGSATPSDIAKYKKIERKFESPEARLIYKKTYDDRVLKIEHDYKNKIASYEKKVANLTNLQNKVTELEKKLLIAVRNLNDIRNSYSYRLGRFLMTPLRLMKKTLKWLKRHVDSMRISVSRRQQLKRTLDYIWNTYALEYDERKKTKINIIIRSIDHPTSSTFIRLISPLSTLTSSTFIRLIDGENIEFSKGAMGADAIIVQRTAIVDVNDAARLVEYVQKHKIKLFVDTDDAFGELDVNHPQYALQKERVDALNHVIEYADQVWFSTEPLKKLYKVKDSKVIRNTLDLKIWDRLRTGVIEVPKMNEPLRMVYMGTVTHDKDFEIVIPALERLHAKYPGKFKLYVIGIARRLEEYPWMEQLKPDSALYPDFVHWFNGLPQFDIGLSPLEDSTFNRNKSDIKCLDYLACGIHPVVSDVEAYKNPELTGLITRVKDSEYAWYDALEEIIVGKEKYRKKMEQAAKKGFSYIMKNRLAERAAESIYESIK